MFPASAPRALGALRTILLVFLSLMAVDKNGKYHLHAPELKTHGQDGPRLRYSIAALMRLNSSAALIHLMGALGGGINP